MAFSLYNVPPTIRNDVRPFIVAIEQWWRARPVGELGREINMGGRRAESGLMVGLRHCRNFCSVTVWVSYNVGLHERKVHEVTIELPDEYATQEPYVAPVLERGDE